MRSAIGLVVLAALATACAGQAPVATTRPDTSRSPSATASPKLTSSPVQGGTPTSGLYLRAWFEQALPPESTFGQLPIVTISDGVAIDGNVAIPAIYPGPIYVAPFARTISSDGQAMIVDEARRLGLVGEETDFTGGGVAPGSQVARLLLLIDGITYDLSGLPDEPSAHEGFATFWQELSMLEAWLGGELGATQEYVPERIAVLLKAPAAAEPGIQRQLRTWPLTGSFEQMGVEFPGLRGARCLTITGEDLTALVPVLEQSNQLTVFHDEVDGQRSASSVVVVPGQESPCGD